MPRKQEKKYNDEIKFDNGLTEEEFQTNKTRNQGKANGLFRSCMDEIKMNHTVGQKLRTMLVTAGVLSDKICYAELLAQFYVTTKALELRLKDRREDSNIVQKIVHLKPGYNFTKGYELDEQHLLGENWKERINTMTTKPANDYISLIQNANDAELVAATFILWGPMIIGGGAALYPRIRRTFGKDATNVFENVIGSGRAQRKRDFIEMFDSIVSIEENEKIFREIVKTCGKFMEMNNKMMVAVRERPWWMYYIWAGTVVATGLLISIMRK